MDREPIAAGDLHASSDRHASAETRASLEPPFARVLSLVLPDERQTLLLRSALLRGDSGRDALIDWQRGLARPGAALGDGSTGGRVLAPLIHANLGPRTAGVDARLLTYLRTAAVREELRWREYRRIAGQALAAIRAAGIEAMTVKGAAFAETVYPRPELRHSHDVDVLVRDADLARSVGALTAAGFDADAAGPDSGTRRVIHATGLPVAVHSSLFPFQPDRLPLEDVWRRAQRAETAGVPGRIPAPPDQLVHVCGLASTTSSRSLLWVCDAWLLIDRTPGLDWDRVLETARAARLSLQLYVTLSYLVREIEAPIRAEVIAGLRDRSMRTGRRETELALFAAWTGPERTIGDLLDRVASRRERAFIVRWRVAPSPSALVSFGLLASRGRWPLFYAARFLRYARRWGGSLLDRRARTQLSHPVPETPGPASGFRSPDA